MIIFPSLRLHCGLENSVLVDKAITIVFFYQVGLHLFYQTISIQELVCFQVEVNTTVRGREIQALSVRESK